MKQIKALEILKSGASTYLTGEPGAGKTHVINEFTKWCDQNDIRYAVTASTGIAATHINGVTIHSWTGIGIKKELTDADIRMIMAKDYIVRQVLQTNVLIIDEISMLNAQTLDNVDRILCAIRGTTLTGEPFGGMQVIFVGDFYQLPPVSRDEKAEFAFRAKSWKAADPVTCYLTEQHRQNDEKFLGILRRMRDGKVTKEDREVLLEKTGKELPKTKLYTHNTDVDRINSEELRKIKNPEHVCNMTARGIPSAFKNEIVTIFENTKWLIWSNEKKMWWKSDHNGYTTFRTLAGRYSFQEAKEIVASANEHMKTLPNEAMVEDTLMIPSN